MAWFGGRRTQRAPAPSPDGYLPARSTAEVREYLLRHPCKCGSFALFSRFADGLTSGGARTLVHEGACRHCGRPQRLAFRLPAVEPESGFGDGVSPLIDAGEWLAIAKARLNGSLEPEVAEKEAAEAVGEAIKFVPPGASRVPRSTLWAQVSLEYHARRPDAFNLAALHRFLDPSVLSTPAPPDAGWAISRPAVRLRLKVVGRCWSGSFSPDGRELAIALGRATGTAEGELAVYTTGAGAGVFQHELADHHDAEVVHVGAGVIVADPSITGTDVVPSALTCFRPGRRDVLMSDAGIVRLTRRHGGFAALAATGEVVLGTADTVRVLPPPGPTACLAADPTGGRLAVGGGRLVLVDAEGRLLASADVPDPLLDVVFLGAPRIVGSGPGYVKLWRCDGDRLVELADTDWVPRLSRLAALPAGGLVLGIDRSRYPTVVEFTDSAITLAALPRGFTTHHMWVDPAGRVMAMPVPMPRLVMRDAEIVEICDVTRWVRPGTQAPAQPRSAREPVAVGPPPSWWADRGRAWPPFRSAVVEAARAEGEPVPAESAQMMAVTMHDGTEMPVIDLALLARNMAGVRQASWGVEIGRIIARGRDGLAEYRARIFARGARELAPDVLPWVHRAAVGAPQSVPVQRRIGGELVATLELMSSDGNFRVTEADVAAWGVDPDDLWEAARVNLRAVADEILVADGFSVMNARRSQPAAHLLRLDELLGGPAPYGVVFVVPTDRTLVFRRLVVADDIGWVGAMPDIVEEAQVRVVVDDVLSERVYWWREGSFEPIDVTTDTAGNVRVSGSRRAESAWTAFVAAVTGWTR